MEAIAMKMTQEEFDSIKDLLPEVIDDEFDLVKYHYLTNNYNDKLGNIGSTDKSLSILNKRVFIEYFDRDIFLKACDIEAEKVWKGSELELWDGNKWCNCANTKYRLKPQPDYSKEIESLQDKAKENGMKAIITFEKL